MKSTNILSLVQAYSSLSPNSYQNFLEGHSITLGDHEVETLKKLIDFIYPNLTSLSVLDSFFVSYEIPQIGKEFDLLRFGEKCLINVELKTTSTDESICEQLVKNKYYLSCLEKELHLFTFVGDRQKIFTLNEHRELVEVDLPLFVNVLESQTTISLQDIDSLFDPSDYLVSPFNSTEKFLKDRYFLTQQQKDFKNKIIGPIEAGADGGFVSITGGPGTGKTLLVYDIYKEILKLGKEPLIVHCGYLNPGHLRLVEVGWNVLPIKKVDENLLSKFDVIILDEVQRIYPNQLTMILDFFNTRNGFCVFSFDRQQTFSDGEDGRKIADKISGIDELVRLGLSEKIRTNKEVAEFIQALFNFYYQPKNANSKNIEIIYFDDTSHAQIYLKGLDGDQWEILRFTPSSYNKEYHEKYFKSGLKKSHEVIGQEFDAVAVVIDEHFSYNKSGKLEYGDKTYYCPVKMLFQNVTRTRKKLKVIIIKNETILNRCLLVTRS